MRIYKTKWFGRFTRSERITDRNLADAVGHAVRGLIDADLGGGLIKQRVARSGQGRSGGYRMLIAYRADQRAVFLYGFAKRERENIGQDELVTLCEIGVAWLAADAARIARAIEEEILQEVHDDEDEGP
ncbi:MAG TPA: type II toxin-antitoxin system RelE/ParE family toxin [Stellaceae bacterium]|nr:type II toxin-antitoxin system RelE/ParE family toxin [Stellaceae bacterium]